MRVCAHAHVLSIIECRCYSSVADDSPLRVQPFQKQPRVHLSHINDQAKKQSFE